MIFHSLESVSPVILASQWCLSFHCAPCSPTLCCWLSLMCLTRAGLDPFRTRHAFAPPLLNCPGILPTPFCYASTPAHVFCLPAALPISIARGSSSFLFVRFLSCRSFRSLPALSPIDFCFSDHDWLSFLSDRRRSRPRIRRSLSASLLEAAADPHATSRSFPSMSTTEQPPFLHSSSFLTREPLPG